MLDSAYKVQGSATYSPRQKTISTAKSTSSASFASQLSGSIGQTASAQRTSQSEAAKSSNLKPNPVLVSKSRSLGVSSASKATDPQSLLAIRMDKPVATHATTVAAPSPKLAEAKAAEVTDPSMAIAPVTTSMNSTSVISLEDASIMALQQAMQAAGIDTSGVHMEVHNNTNSYMMGSYQDRQLVVTMPGGRSGSYSADLVARNAAVALTDMRNDHLV